MIPNPLSSDGSSLNISGMNLESTLGNVNSVVKAIESGAFTGTAADEFVAKYNSIKENLNNFAVWMQNMGKSMVTSADNATTVDKAGKDAIQ